MDPLSVAATSGLQTRMDSLSLLANNLANAGTSGYKSDREFYGLFTSSNADDPAGGGDFLSALPVVNKQWTDFSQGTLQTTGSPLDIALSGHGFLAVNGPGGELYTRNGSLRVAPNGELITGEGYKLRSAGGGTISVSAGSPIEIAKDGTVSQNGQPLGQIEIVDFKSTDSLKKMSGAVFQNTDLKNKPVPATDVEVQQGRTEGSNVVVPESAMRLVGMMRQFEMLQKAITLNTNMNEKAISEVARIPT
ncbi:MAG TPA: flagellar hook basal-body protein [Bryobacteraceae bacterium]|nr:flagellar hook basal-body protein [Bryobacteraceae bacterium]